jgi:hypothetical protein
MTEAVGVGMKTLAASAVAATTAYSLAILALCIASLSEPGGGGFNEDLK